MRWGVLVNPDAGLGGRLGYKGTDGRAEEARQAGAEERARPRARETLEHLAVLLERRHRGDAPTLVVCGGPMGDDALPESTAWTLESGPAASMPTSADDTRHCVAALVAAGVDGLLYAGGDGTTRDIVAGLEDAGAAELPIVGIPSGVKMHSGCFAATPKAAAEVLMAWLEGHLDLARTEVMDLDEAAYRDGEWVVRLYAEAFTPSAPRWMQGVKEIIPGTSEDEVLDGLATHLGELSSESPELLLIWGSGGTLRHLMTEQGLIGSLLGIDASLAGRQVGRDLDEVGLLALLDAHDIDATTPHASGDVRLLLSPMGGQGFLLGRGNLQLSPEVLRRIGPKRLLGVATPAKLASLDGLRIDTGDPHVDAAIHELRYLPILQGYRTTRLLRVLD